MSILFSKHPELILPIDRLSMESSFFESIGRPLILRSGSLLLGPETNILGPGLNDFFEIGSPEGLGYSIELSLKNGHKR